MMLQRWTMSVTAALLALAVTLPATANRRQMERELALAIAQVAANEYRTDDERGLWGGTVPSELLLIVQVTESHGGSPLQRLMWLSRHSCRVLEHPDGRCPKACTGGNCGWTRNLSWSDDKPDGWPDPYPWRPEVWEGMRRLSLAAVRGRVTVRPCLGRPTTWGSRSIDYDAAVARGMVPLSCDTPRDGNVGFHWLRRGSEPGRAIPAALAMPGSSTDERPR
jgi:hypothetical protein